MGTSAEELRREIADTRSDLGDTLDAIGDRVSPGRVIERRKNRMRNGWQSFFDRVMGPVHEAAGAVESAPGAMRDRAEGAPLVAGALAFGVGFLVAAAIPPSQRERQLAPKLQEKVEPLKQELMGAGREVGEHLSEPAKESMTAVKDAATQGAQTVMDEAKSAASDTKQHATEAAGDVSSRGSG